jgi:hypothetical protein
MSMNTIWLMITSPCLQVNSRWSTHHYEISSVTKHIDVVTLT